MSKDGVFLDGFAVCRFGGIVHNHDGDSQRANRLVIISQDGGERKKEHYGVYCIFCGTRGPSTFDALINGAGEGTGRIVRQDSVLDYRYGVTLGPSAWASVVFEDVKQFDDTVELGTDFGEAYVPPPAEAKLPECIDKVASALSRLGFRVTGSHATNTMGTIIMVMGRRLFPGDPERPALDGVKIELSWLY